LQQKLTKLKNKLSLLYTVNRNIPDRIQNTTNPKPLGLGIYEEGADAIALSKIASDGYLWEVVKCLIF
jgi:hypothetical protein